MQDQTSRKLNTLYTVDTEVWPRCNNWKNEQLEKDIARDIYGATPKGQFGIQYQADMLNQYNLKGVFFVEALFACEVGITPLKRIVDTLQSSGHEVQLHIHTEWLKFSEKKILSSAKTASNMKDLSLNDQQNLIEIGLNNLHKAGADCISAFRAGNYGANNDTLKALANCGIKYDSSYNYPFLHDSCGLRSDTAMTQPYQISDITEIPVSFFRDLPGHNRHVQLCAINSNEMINALNTAFQVDWNTFVIVSHGFELLKDRKQASALVKPDWEVIKRFDSLCHFLSENNNMFDTVGFNDLPNTICQPSASVLKPSLWSTIPETCSRHISQARRRLY